MLVHFHDMHYTEPNCHIYHYLKLWHRWFTSISVTTLQVLKMAENVIKLYSLLYVYTTSVKIGIVFENVAMLFSIHYITRYDTRIIELWDLWFSTYIL